MHSSKNKATNWFRVALKLGLLATDATVWVALNRALSERGDSHDTLRTRQAEADLRARLGPSRFATLLTGIGIGVGVGMLFAPVSGKEARSVIREKAEDVRDKWNDATAWAGLGAPTSRRTGTYAD